MTDEQPVKTYGYRWMVLLASGFAFGFFLLSAGPVGFQYAAEISRPAPAGTSNTLLLVMGQISGIIFIFAMDALKSKSTGSMTASLVGLAVLAGAAALLALRVRESPIHGNSKSIAGR